MLDFSCLEVGENDSIWWNYVVGLGLKEGESINWFAKFIPCKLGIEAPLVFGSTCG